MVPPGAFNRAPTLCQWLYIPVAPGYKENDTQRERPAEGDTATKYRQLWPHRVFHPLVPIHFHTPPQMATAVTQKFLYHLVRRALLT